jgi:ATP-dependent Clp protease ATP-binding subunit ClpB
LDDGRLTDGQGRTVDFKNTVIIMTSNLGSDLIQENAKEHTYEQMKSEVMDVLARHFRPEFINRVDETVVFHPLGADEIRSIAQFQLELLYQRLEEREYHLELDDDALAHLARTGFDPVFGARPLKRAIQQELENPLAQKILSGELAPEKTIKVCVENEKLMITQ